VFNYGTKSKLSNTSGFGMWDVKTERYCYVVYSVKSQMPYQ